MTKQHYVTIKGTKDGLVLRLDDKCAYSDMIAELRNKVSENSLEGLAEVKVHIGSRYCNEEELKEIMNIVHESPHLRVSKIQSEVITLEECNRRILENQSETYIGIVRSGQVVKADGDLVVIGDVNPNGRVVAAGSIYILGRLKGIAHAGATGNEEAVIAASWLEATHLMIADKMETMTDELTILSDQPEMECAYIHPNGFIAIDRLQELRILRPNLSTFKGGS
ncbi:septum site-determining protein MinC [Sporosarcina thermotolerans]|uniref:Probable septum site-determining protein MinC n=1 Tax=Sporosarcina thermotolerans TaxID=633404 RepID=A0AAW9AAX0_9BACL|nr:septum site-determining protein MinC [Sporosarcina thermotolerans]MDW0118100.1 septum site-determining protein MinC [Sporosarcina thermotolerans]WHT47593.1 septum site-determining protein MinC [Sporosarcina thermotolerans]